MKAVWTIKNEINEALKKLNFKASECSQLDKEKAIKKQKLAMDKYVDGNPRSWWMSLKRPHESYEYSFPSDHITQHLKNPKHNVYWIPETEENRLPVYDMDPSIINKILELTPAFEYYVVTKDFTRLIIETDHGDLWVVN